MSTFITGLGGAEIAHLLLRVCLGLFFAISGFHKLYTPDRRTVFVGTLAQCGVPMPHVLCWPVAFVEFMGGIWVALGFLTPLAAVGLLGVIVVALLTDGPRRVAAMQPIDAGDWMDDWLYLSELWYGLALLVVATHGAGPLSLDGYMRLWWLT